MLQGEDNIGETEDTTAAGAAARRAKERIAAGGGLDTLQEGESISSLASLPVCDEGGSNAEGVGSLGSEPDWDERQAAIDSFAEDVFSSAGTSSHGERSDRSTPLKKTKSKRCSIAQLGEMRREEKQGARKGRGPACTTAKRRSLVNMKRQSMLAAEASVDELAGRRATNISVRMSELKRAYGSIGPSRFYNKPTLAEFSAVVERNQSTLCGGIVSDFLYRMMSSVREKGDPGKDQDTMLKIMSISQASPQDAGTMSEVFNGYEYASSIMSRERLYWCLTHPITRVSKSRGAFDAVRLHRWKFWANKFWKMKRQVMLIRKEVSFFIMSYNLLHHRVKEYQEPFLERKQRMDEFWRVFHERGRTIQDQTREKALSPIRLGRSDRDRGKGTTSSNSPSSPQAKTHGRGMVMLPKDGVTSDFGICQRWKVVEPAWNTMSHFSPQRRDHKGDSDPATHSPFQVKPSQGSPKSETTGGAGGHFSGRTRDKASSGHKSSEKGIGEKRASSLPNLNSAKDTHCRAMAGAGARHSLPPISGTLPPISKDLEAGKVRYLEECDFRQKLPIPLSFTTGHKEQFEAAGRDLVDTDLLPVISMLSAHHVTTVNLQNNSLLTDRSLVPFLRDLSQRVTHLHQLDLSYCKGAGGLTIESTIAVLKDASKLQKLDLCSIPIGTQLQIPLCSAIGKHATLKVVGLADIGLNNEYITQKCVEVLFSSRTVDTLDLSWNCFTAHTFEILGERVEANQVVRHLSVSNCSAAVVQHTTPIASFLEYLAHDKDLNDLDISMNRIDHRCALILEDCLEHHRQLHSLNLANNPLGIDGMRNVLRLLARDNTGLVFFETEGCYNDCGDIEKLDSQIFNAMNPGRPYVLHLNKPYHRSILRMLYKAMEKFGLQPEGAFKDVKHTKMPYEHPKKSGDVWHVLKTGVLRFTFCIDSAIEATMQGIPDWDFGEFLKRYFHTVRLQPGWKKVTPLFARWRQLDGRVAEQRTYVSSLSLDFDLTLPYLEYMCISNPQFLNEAIWRLWNCIPNDKASQFSIMMLFPRFPDMLWTRQRLASLLEFNVMNPTGRYHLNLDNCADHAVAERLLLLDRWESTVDSRHGRTDISQYGNFSHVRNEMYQKKSLHKVCENFAQWRLPDVGELDIDYVSSFRPQLDLHTSRKIMSDDLWESLLGSLYDSPCASSDKIAVMRAISHHIYILSMHLRQLMGYFKSQDDRAEAFVIFYPRIVDLHNTKIFRVRFEDPKEVQSLRDRLGHATFFPFMQPENERFDLDLSFHDQRVCASILTQLARRERIENIHEPEFFHADGTKDWQLLYSGIPPTWVTPKGLPKEGHFKCLYVCSPEDRKFAFRKQLAETYGFVCNDVHEEDVMWWTGLLEVPEDALELLEFLIVSGCHDINEAFKKIDGPDGNGVITLREFEDGIKEMECKKFCNPKDPKAEGLRVAALFRWLDTGGEGSVSKMEFAVLGQLWKEFELSVTEFVHFLRLTFGTDDLWSAWEILDDDASGEITSVEWVQAVTDIGYWGPSEVVFSLLDTSDDGAISFDEFEVLEKYQTIAKARRPTTGTGWSSRPGTTSTIQNSVSTRPNSSTE